MKDTWVVVVQHPVDNEVIACTVGPFDSEADARSASRKLQESIHPRAELIVSTLRSVEEALKFKSLMK